MIKEFKTFLLLISAVVKPHFRTDPVFALFKVVDKQNREKAEAQEKEIELVLLGGLKLETSQLTIPVDARVKGQGEDKEEKSVKQPHELLVEESRSLVKCCNYYPTSHCEGQAEKKVNDGFVHWGLDIFHSVHDNVVYPKRGNSVQVIRGTAEIKSTSVAHYFWAHPEGTTVFI